jgi:sortase A
MKKFFGISKDFLLLISGSLLLIGGIVGGIILFTSSTDDSSRLAYFQTETAAAATQRSGPIFTTTPSQANSETPTGTPMPKGYEILAEAYYVHAPAASGLETPAIPDRIVIPAIGLDAPVVVSEFTHTEIEGQSFGQWLAPNEYAAGWQPNSALLGQPGNTVINGHHNEFGEVFGKIVDLKVGDEIYLYSGDREFVYVVANEPMKLLELYQNVETRLNNARWLEHSDDTRLTLVTCWPPLSNTYRVIVVARPKGD